MMQSLISSENTSKSKQYLKACKKNSVELHGLYLVFSFFYGKSHLAFIPKHAKPARGWGALSIPHLSDYMLLQLKPTETSKFPSARDGLGIIDRYRSSRTRENINLKGLND
jgi:hypothetical protein